MSYFSRGILAERRKLWFLSRQFFPHFNPQRRTGVSHFNRLSKCINSPNFYWKIEDITSARRKVCPPVVIGGLKWQLRFCRFLEDGTEKIRLLLECLNNSELLGSLRFKINVYLVHDNGLRDFVRDVTYNLLHKELCIWHDHYSRFQETYGEVADVTFLVMITPAGKPECFFRNHEHFEKPDDDALCLKTMKKEFGKLFNSAKHGDFILKCGEKSFYVHKNILSARSEYFAAMFRYKMKETNEGAGKIEGIEPDILEMVLRYIYTCEIPDMPLEPLQKLYTAADKFSVESLKIRCHSLFVDKFTSDSEKESYVVDKFLSEEANDESEKVSKSADVKAELPKEKEKQLLKDLFTTREWRMFSQEFPYKAQEMCRPYLLEK